MRAPHFGLAVVAVTGAFVGASHHEARVSAQAQSPAPPAVSIPAPAAVSMPAPAAVSMIVPEGEGAGYWPRWRGPSGQGIGVGAGYVDTWSDKQNILWHTAVRGRGNSSPIVWKDRIFLTTGYDDGRTSILSFDRATGRQLWEAFNPDRTREWMHQKNTLASATPSTDGTRIYASFGSKGILAVDFDGTVAWQRSLGTLDNYHGTAGSPLIYKDRLIVFQDHVGGSQGRGFVAALATSDGRVLWRSERRETIGWSTPIAIRVGDHDEIVVSSELRVQAYNPDTGRELWSAYGNTDEVIPTPVVGGGLVFCASGRAGPTLAIRPGGKGDVTRTHIEWQSPRGSPFVPSPLYYNDQLYLLNDMASIATSFDAASGKVLWQGRLGVAMSEGFSSSPIGVDGKVFFTNDYGETFVLRAGPKFELLHVNKLDAMVLASPALVDGRWYFRTDRELLAIGK